MEIAGIDADSIISQLMQIEQRPLAALQARQSAARVSSEAIGRIRSKVDAFRLAAGRLSLASTFVRTAAKVTGGTGVLASVGSAATPGSLSFTVNQLAQAHGLRSLGTVSSNTVTVTSESFLAVAAGTDSIGIQTVRAGAGLAAGNVNVSVTQASASARVNGVGALAASTVVDGTNNTLDVVIDGVARSMTITAGTYSPAAFVTAVQDAINATGGGATASLDGTGAIELATTREGSAATLEITGGSALGALGLSVDTTAHVGVDGVFNVNGTATTVTSLSAGDAVAIDTGAGTLDVKLSGGLRVGDVKVAVVSTGDRSLAAVAAAVTGANAGVNAAAVRVDAGAWRLQLTSTKTGEGARIAIDQSTLTGLGGMIESSSARNAQISIGSGAGAYTVEASGNTFTDVMPGVTITATEASGTPVTVTVERDNASIADDVSKMVSAINDLLGDIKVQTRTDPTAGTSGPLAGNSTIRRLADQMRDALAGQVSGLAVSLPASVGIERTREGSFTFDRDKFLAAIAADPAAVTRLFARGGTETGDVVFATADQYTVSGSYAIDITTAATQAASATLFAGGTTDTRLGLRLGTTTVTVDVQAGQSIGQVVERLNESFADSGLGLVAEADGTGLRIRAREWGSGGDFEMNEDVLGVGTWDGIAGADVAGTIDGLVATGKGRRLILSPTATSRAAGLGVDVAGGVSGVLGNVDYRPGIAARVVEVTSSLTRASTGLITTAKAFAEARISSFGDQIERLEDRLFVREANMRRQWSAFQTLLGGLQSQSSWLTGQLASLNNNWGTS